jgi:hypothetical protein
MSKPTEQKPEPKAAATAVPATKISHPDHEENRMDEALDESFPASDPPAIVNPSGSMAVKKLAEEGRAEIHPEEDLPGLTSKPGDKPKPH